MELGDSEGAFRLNGKVCLVTGGTRGIGEAIAEDFVAAGARVILTGRDESQARAVAEKIGAAAIGLAYDAAAPDAGADLAERVTREVGRLDVLVNNAAILKPHRVDRLTETEFDQIFQVNTKANIFLCQRLKPLLAQGGGAIVNITAAGGHVPMAGIGAYCASKAAILNFTRTLAKEWAADGIRVNALTPGSVATDMILPKDEARRAQFVTEMAEANLLKRLALPLEIARIARFLASPAAAFITGQVLIADGGLLA
jgi:NAD(P)-dependent dehydrogenase (short-subunit alcohol dehydrogenase family)